MSDKKVLFLSQSYKDAQEEYLFSTTSTEHPHWDYVFITASDEAQAEGYRLQIEKREREGRLPKGTRFVFVPDEGGERVGSGGATLSVLRELKKREGRFNGLRVLVIHSGGDSKRVPQYSAIGKLFSPVPHMINGKMATLFDEFLISTSMVPGRMREGMLLMSGDVLLLFNALQIDFPGEGAAAVSFKAPVETGKNHGVYLCDEETGNVARFLHKQSEEALNRMGAVNDRGEVDIDTGAVIFSRGIMEKLYALVDTEEKYRKLVNSKVRLSLYGDFEYPLAARAKEEDFYAEPAEGEMCEELLSARKQVWETLASDKLKLCRLAPARFLHFGTSRELLKLMTEDIGSYEPLDWTGRTGCSFADGPAGYNSIVSKGAKVGEGCYLESSYVHKKASVGNGCILSYIDVRSESIPDGAVVHGLKLNDGRFQVRIFGTGDNPKEDIFFGKSLSEMLDLCGCREGVWEDGVRPSLWEAKIFPVRDTIGEALKDALALKEHLCRGEKYEIKKSLSLKDGFRQADPKGPMAWESRMRELVQMDAVRQAIHTGRPKSEMPDIAELTENQKEWLEKRVEENKKDPEKYRETMRLQFYLNEPKEAFRTIGETLLKGAERIEAPELKSGRKTCIVRKPLRVNFGGGWSDTPPYCNELGGTVLNAAITLNGSCPVSVVIEPLEEEKVVFDSRDMDVHGEFTSIQTLADTGDPYDPFALQKAALKACGIVKEGEDFASLMKKTCGGFIIRSEVTGVPKGSGLGTSSILAGACVQCLYEYFGIEYTNDGLYEAVMLTEQIMSTGGGWQDQVGGLTNGFKLISSRPGIRQTLKVDEIRLDEETKSELSDRFALIYTGQRRLARNLLRDVIGRYIGNEKDSLFALNEIQKLAVLMRFELERGHVDDFAGLLNQHWELSKMIDSGSSNSLIEMIFTSIEDLIAGRMICGAGGGGFLQVILKKGVSAEDLRKRLKEVFSDSSIDVWDAAFV